MGKARDNTPPLTRDSVKEAHELIKPYIHLTPVLTSQTLSTLASTPQTLSTSKSSPPAHPRVRLFFKCENYQKVGAFKARGAFHALARLDAGTLRKTGVVTHSSGNHAQALALAARTHGIPAHIVMPSISTPSKIAGTRGYGANIVFSGSTAPEREAVTRQVIEDTGATFVPPYDHPNIILGQGTMALELQAQVEEILKGETSEASGGLDAVIAPCGGGGMLSGIATALAGTGIRVFGAEPSFQGADDARRGLAAGKRVTAVSTLTIADGLRTPVGEIPWSVISDPEKVHSIYGVDEEQIKSAMRLVLERMKVFVEPSGVVGLAAVLYDEGLRRVLQDMVDRKAEQGNGSVLNLGVVFSGGNTTLEAIAKMFGTSEADGERAEGVVGMNGQRVAENVPG